MVVYAYNPRVWEAMQKEKVLKRTYAPLSPTKIDVYNIYVIFYVFYIFILWHMKNFMMSMLMLGFVFTVRLSIFSTAWSVKHTLCKISEVTEHDQTRYKLLGPELVFFYIYIFFGCYPKPRLASHLESVRPSLSSSWDYRCVPTHRTFLFSYSATLGNKFSREQSKTKMSHFILTHQQKLMDSQRGRIFKENPFLFIIVELRTRNFYRHLSHLKRMEIRH